VINTDFKITAILHLFKIYAASYLIVTKILNKDFGEIIFSCGIETVIQIYNLRIRSFFVNQFQLFILNHEISSVDS
jgi:hypothetical protein